MSKKLVPNPAYKSATHELGFIHDGGLPCDLRPHRFATAPPDEIWISQDPDALWKWIQANSIPSHIEE